MRSKSARQIRSAADKIKYHIAGRCGLRHFTLRGASAGTIRSLQSDQPCRRHDGGVILHLDKTHIDQRAQIVIRDRYQLKPIAKDVAKGPAKADGPFEIKICKRFFRHGVEMNGPPIGSLDVAPVRQTVHDIDFG